MNMKPVILIPILIIGLGVLPKAQALSPAPDGGYPGQNTAEGQSALLHLAGGTYNTALGWASLGFNVTGNYNTGVGAATLLNNTASENTATGAGALLSNIVGEENTANGAFALFSNTEGDFNTANGSFALFGNSTGERNTATGNSALYSNTTGNFNTATGNAALGTNTSGSRNTANGSFALFANNADFNTATGYQALFNNTTGHDNTANGYQVLNSNTTGSDNTANGASALYSNTTGSNNTANGIGALVNNTTGNNNTALGRLAGAAVATADNVICIGASVLGANVSNSCYIGQIFGATSSGGTAVFINSDGKLGTTTSSRRFKEEIKPMERASEALFALKPVTFRYKKEIDPTGTSQFGLVAEEVAAVNTNLVVYDKEGKVNTVRYEAVNAMLLNEFLKEHRKVQEQEATIAELQSGMKALAATLNEQASQLQNVSAQLELNRPAPQQVALKIP
jgi:Chaperone of endosialidase